MDSDPNIRHSIIADSDGNIIATNHRPEVANHLSPEETAASLKRAAVAWKGRNELAPKIGKGLYAIAVFEKITRMTFPLGPKTRRRPVRSNAVSLVEQALSPPHPGPTTTGFSY